MLKNIFARLHSDEKGAAIVEYAVALLVVIAIGITVFSTMGNRVAEISSSACDTLHGAAGTAGCS